MMMTYLRFACLLLAALCTFPDACKARKTPKFSVNLQGCYGYVHVMDPLWNDCSWRRFGFQLDAGYRRLFIKMRPWSFGNDMPYLPRDRSHYNRISIPGFEYVRSYTITDLSLGFNVSPFRRHRIMAWAGASRCSAQEHVTDGATGGMGGAELRMYRRKRDEWGALAEVSYDCTFLKYCTAGAQISYRAYPVGDNILYAELTLGLKLAR